jgi:hypothetical protein
MKIFQLKYSRFLFKSQLKYSRFLSKSIHINDLESLKNTLDPFKESSLDISENETNHIKPFTDDIIKKLSQPVNIDDIEVKPEGILYVPEIKYRRALMQAFGPGGWGLIPKSNHIITNKTLSREYALFCNGRFVAQARGEQEVFDQNNMVTATEGVKSNALMRCCKDLGIFYELWDPRFIRDYKQKYVHMVQAQYKGQNKWIWKKKDVPLQYPFKPIN